MRGLLVSSILLASLALGCSGQSSSPPGSTTVNGASGGAVANPGTAGQETPNTNPPPGDSGTPPPTDPTGTGPACGDKTCAADEQCIEYYGIAGPRGPKFQECGIPCPSGKGCPPGKTCQTIADGPGPVCR